MPRPKHKELLPVNMDFSITPLPASNPLQDHILRQGLFKNMPMQPPPQPDIQQGGYQPKRPSVHPSGAETDTELPTKKKSRSPPKTPTQGSPVPGQIRRGNSFNTPPQGRAFAAGSQLGLLGLTAVAGAHARSSSEGAAEAKKEEEQDDDVVGRGGNGRQGNGGFGGILDGSIGSSTNLTFMSSITDDQWRQLREDHELQGTEGDDEGSENGEGGIIMGQEQNQQQQRQQQQNQQQQQQRGQPQQTGWGDHGALRTIGLGPGFAGMGRAKVTTHVVGGQALGAQREYHSMGGNVGLNIRHSKQPQQQHNPQPLSQLDESLDFTDTYTETEGGDYTEEFDNAAYKAYHADGAQEHEPIESSPYSETPQPGNLGPNHPPSGTVYRPRSPSPTGSSIFDPPSPDHSSASPTTIEDILALDYSQENIPKRFNFFRNCTHEEWERYGDVILQLQMELAKEMMESRAERKKAAGEFEEELRSWEGEVDGNMEKAKQYMARMKTSFELLKVG